MNDFINSLQGIKLDNVFNPWFSYDVEHDIDTESPDKRLTHLRQYLSERKDAKYLLLAEAMGYQGGHFTGIPMTSERILLGKMKHKSIDPGHVFSNIEPQRTSKIRVRKDGFSEPTATIVWEKLIHSGFDMRDFIFWNAFPWHPYNPKKGLLSNRTPSDREFENGEVVLNQLLKIQKGIKIIAIGEKAKKQLLRMGMEVPSVRHPANGGATKFRTQIIREINKTG